MSNKGALSDKELSQLRSGQQYVRVWGVPYIGQAAHPLAKAKPHTGEGRQAGTGNGDYDMHFYLERHVIQGKPSRKNAEHCTNPNHPLNGGIRHFHTERAAQRYIDELHADLHPDVTFDTWEFHYEFDLVDEAWEQSINNDVEEPCYE